MVMMHDEHYSSTGEDRHMSSNQLFVSESQFLPSLQFVWKRRKIGHRARVLLCAVKRSRRPNEHTLCLRLASDVRCIRMADPGRILTLEGVVVYRTWLDSNAPAWARLGGART